MRWRTRAIPWFAIVFVPLRRGDDDRRRRQTQLLKHNKEFILYNICEYMYKERKIEIWKIYIYIYIHFMENIFRCHAFTHSAIFIYDYGWLLLSSLLEKKIFWFLFHNLIDISTSMQRISTASCMHNTRVMYACCTVFAFLQPFFLRRCCNLTTTRIFHFLLHRKTIAFSASAFVYYKYTHAI